MTEQNLLKMIMLEIELLKEQFDNCEYQSDYPKYRSSCVKIRKDLKELIKELTPPDDE